MRTVGFTAETDNKVLPTEPEGVEKTAQAEETEPEIEPEKEKKAFKRRKKAAEAEEVKTEAGVEGEENGDNGSQ